MSSIAFSATQSEQEETVNALSHAVGVGLAAGGLPWLLVVAAATGDAGRVVGAAIFGATLVVLYASSALYHACPVSAPHVKMWLDRCDHIAIYLLIAGTYTPYTLVTLRGPWGWTLFGIVWACATGGIALTLFDKQHRRRLRVASYLAMGWVAVIAVVPLVSRLSGLGLMWLALGGIFYSVGVPFYLAHRRRYFHALWHLFVLAGSICHYLGILWYVLPN